MVGRTSDTLQGTTTRYHFVLHHVTKGISEMIHRIRPQGADLCTSSSGLATSNREYSSIIWQVKDKPCIPIGNSRE